MGNTSCFRPGNFFWPYACQRVTRAEIYRLALCWNNSKYSLTDTCLYFFVSSQFPDTIGIDIWLKYSPEIIQKTFSFLFTGHIRINAFISAVITLALYEGAPCHWNSKGWYRWYSQGTVGCRFCFRDESVSDIYEYHSATGFMKYSVPTCRSVYLNN